MRFDTHTRKLSGEGQATQQQQNLGNRIFGLSSIKHATSATRRPTRYPSRPVFGLSLGGLVISSTARIWSAVAVVAAIGAIAAAQVGSVAHAQGRTVLLLEEEVIKGEVQKPTVTLFVTRQNINTDATLELRESFVPRIIESVEKKPF